jgi:hypothetical protein
MKYSLLVLGLQVDLNKITNLVLTNSILHTLLRLILIFSNSNYHIDIKIAAKFTSISKL